MAAVHKIKQESREKKEVGFLKKKDSSSLQYLSGAMENNISEAAEICVQQLLAAKKREMG